METISFISSLVLMRVGVMGLRLLKCHLSKGKIGFVLRLFRMEGEILDYILGKPFFLLFVLHVLHVPKNRHVISRNSLIFLRLSFSYQKFIIDSFDHNFIRRILADIKSQFQFFLTRFFIILLN